MPPIVIFRGEKYFTHPVWYNFDPMAWKSLGLEGFDLDYLQKYVLTIQSYNMQQRQQICIQHN